MKCGRKKKDLKSGLLLVLSRHLFHILKRMHIAFRADWSKMDVLFKEHVLRELFYTYRIKKNLYLFFCNRVALCIPL